MAKKSGKLRVKSGEMPSVRVPTLKVKKSAAESWLERTNPLVGLSIRTAQNIFDCARSGDTQRLHWLFQEIEAVNPVLMTCVERRAAAISNFQWTVTNKTSADQTLADEQQAAVKELISGIDNFTELLEHLDSAFFRGFAIAQPIWREDGFCRAVQLLNSWEFLQHEGKLYHNGACDGFNLRNCVDCTDARLVTLNRARAIDYPALAIHIRHAVSTRDWGRFLERYALPKPAVTMAPNATNEQRNDYILAAQMVENGQVSVWPSGSMLTDFAGGSRGTDPFAAFIAHQEKTIVLLATGGTLTSLAQADTGSLAGGAQMDVWKEIVRRDAAVIAQSLTRGIVKPFLQDTFFGRPVAVDFALDLPTKMTAKESAELAGLLRNAGYTVKQEELEKAVGFTLEKYEAMPPVGIARRAICKNEKADSSSLNPILEEFFKNPTEEEAEKIMEKLPSLVPDDPVQAAIIAEEMAKAMSKELEKTPQNHVEKQNKSL